MNQHIFKVYGHDCHTAWLYWVLRAVTHEVEQRAHGIIGMVHITRGELDAVRIPVPPQPLQRAIADFLDRKTAAIDVLIEKKERLIALLQEKRQALITQAVTKGLDPNVPMKDSGIEWLGEIPAHWTCLPLRRGLLAIEQGWSPNAADRLAEAGEWGVLKLSAVTGGVWDWTAHKTLDCAPEPQHQRYRLRQGDLLITRANTVALVADAVVVPEEPPVPLIMSDLIYRLHTTSALDSRFAALVLRSSIGRLQVGRDARGTSMSMAKVSQGQIRSWLFPFPPIREQIAIVESTLRRSRALRAVEAKAEASISRFGEYRQAVITAAVTGKLDVTSEAA